MTPTQIYGLLFFAVLFYSTLLDGLRWLAVKVPALLLGRRD
jgi:hypothetical protein